VTVTIGAAVGGTVVMVDGGSVELDAARVVGAFVEVARTFALAFGDELPQAAATRTSARAAIGIERVMRLLIVTASLAPELRYLTPPAAGGLGGARVETPADRLMLVEP
jgi:hypothetical protein